MTRNILKTCLFVSAFLLKIFCLESKEFSSIPNTSEWKYTSIGIHVINLNTKEEVISYQADKLLMGASLQKIFTSAAAVHFLGNSFKFETKLYYDGSIQTDGMLNGNLWIKGGGDPTLQLQEVTRWAQEAKSKGISKVSGLLIADCSCFETLRSGRKWCFEDLGNYYGSGACGLTVNESSYTITLSPGSSLGMPATIHEIDSLESNMTFYNETYTADAGTGENVYAFSSEGSSLGFLRGTVSIDKPYHTIKCALMDPALSCGQYLASHFSASKGIKVEKYPFEYPSNLHLIACTYSPSLFNILKEMNFRSHNLYAEHLFKKIGEGRAQRAKEKIQEWLDGLDIKVVVEDGSGLSRTNLVTARGVVSLLDLIYFKDPYNLIRDTLPEVGKEGTVKYFPVLEGCIIKAKTGSMHGVNNLAGYIYLPSGTVYAFCFLLNHFTGESKEVRQIFSQLLKEIILDETH